MSVNQVSRANPALIIFLADMSGSMSEEIIYEGKMLSKNVILSKVLNLTLSEITHKCKRGDNYRDYFNIVVLGYDGSGVTSLLEKYSKSSFSTINDLINSDAQKVVYHSTHEIDGKTYMSTKSCREYVKIGALERTPMYEALTQAYTLTKMWINIKGANSVAPMIINITDGGATDASEVELIDISKKIKSLNSAGGEVILTNIHICDIEPDKTIMFPRENKDLESIKYANLLYNMSSELPVWLSKGISDIIGSKLVDGDRLRAISYNTSVSQLFDILQIGSLSINE